MSSETLVEWSNVVFIVTIGVCVVNLGVDLEVAADLIVSSETIFEHLFKKLAKNQKIKRRSFKLRKSSKFTYL